MIRSAILFGAMFLSVLASLGAQSAQRPPVPNACTFIARADLEKMVGRELRDGKPKDVSPGLSQCEFSTPAGAYVTRTFPNPALPDASGFSSLTITTYPSTPATFDQGRNLAGPAAAGPAGLGDVSYFASPAMIHVRKGNRGFSIRVYVNEPKTDAGRAKLRQVMIALARAGVGKL